MKTFMNITNYRSKSSNPLAPGISANATSTAMPVSTTGYNQTSANTNI